MFSDCRLRINSFPFLIAAGYSPSFFFRHPVALCEVLLYLDIGIVFPVELKPLGHVYL